MNRNLGCFVSCAGGLQNILDRGDKLGVNTVMTHPAPPQRWNSQAFKQEVVDAYLSRKAKGTGVERVYFHGIYLINLANPSKQQWHLSKVSVMNHLDLLQRIEGDGVVFHTGTFKDWDDEEKGYEQVIFSINWIFKNLPKVETSKGYWDKPRLLLECAAGAGGKVIGDKLEELEKIYNSIDDENKPKVGFCLDTQHLFAGGYDIKNNLENIVVEADKILGLDKIPAIHFNDSKTELGSNRDRHENLGEGLIGADALKAFLNHPKLKDKDFIMETPSLDDEEGSQKQVAILKSWAK